MARERKEGESRADWAKRTLKEDGEALKPYQERRTTKEQALGVLGNMQGHAKRIRAEAMFDSGFKPEGTPADKIQPNDTVVPAATYDAILTGQLPLPDAALERAEELTARDFSRISGMMPAGDRGALPPKERGDTPPPLTFAGRPLEEVMQPGEGPRTRMPDVAPDSAAYAQEQRLRQQVDPNALAPEMASRFVVQKMEDIEQKYKDIAPDLAEKAHKAKELHEKKLPERNAPQETGAGAKQGAPAQEGGEPPAKPGENALLGGNITIEGFIQVIAMIAAALTGKDFADLGNKDPRQKQDGQKHEGQKHGEQDAKAAPPPKARRHAAGQPAAS